jgi:NAD(P)-dependent dehydrogenase (short-subunit alcohol dehydrogenase family)
MSGTEVHVRIEQSFGAHLPIAGDRLAGRVALISGAGRAGSYLGTGAATALLFAAQGAAVGLFDVDGGRAEATAGLIREAGGRCEVIVGDVRSARDCEAAVERTSEAFGGLDVLMNNTAITRPGGIDTVTDADWDQAIDVNLKGVMLLSRAALPRLAVRKGAIVNVASIAAQQGFGVVAYAASKGGVIAMTRDMAFTAGPSGVRVNCIVPGHLVTPMGGADNPARRDIRRRATLLGVEGSAWDVAWAALFLAGPEARWITAATLNVDAGSPSQSSLNTLLAIEG